MNADIFIELSIVLVIALVITTVMKLLKQPSIIGYILTGIIAGPFVLDHINSTDVFITFSQKGVALLLFLVGLSLNPKVIKEVGKVSLITGIGQVLFTSGIGFAIAKLLGFPTNSALYLSVALAFSSTIVIMKLLSDKKDLETLYGRISVGFLIIQDLIVIIFLLIISSFSNETSLASFAVAVLIKGVGGIAVLFLIATYALPYVMKVVARSQEVLFLFSLTWCFAIASAFHYLNFSIEAGALLAGISLSVSPYHYEISAKMRPLRDFFLILFFILMGSQMVFENIFLYIGEILILSFFVLIGNPIIVMILMGILGYTKRNSFQAGLTVAQISEFSLIIIAMGVSVGHVNNTILSITTAIALITFTGSTYLILYSNKIFPYLEKYLSIFERKNKIKKQRTVAKKDHHILLFGYNKVSFDILDSLQKLKKKFLVIDYDPEVIASASEKGHDCIYGDANDSELLDELNFKKAKMIISTIHVLETNLLLLSKIHEENEKAIVAVVAHSIDDALKLYDNGATYVIMPHILGGKHFSTMINKHKLGTKKFLKEKIAHIEHINEKKKLTEKVNAHLHPHLNLKPKKEKMAKKK